MTQWHTSDGLTDYETALEQMQAHVDAMIAGQAVERVWLLEHPPLYTAGTSAKQADLLDASRFPVYDAGRGGEYTYHGPGQRIAYCMLNLNRRGKDLRAYVGQLEQWLILTLAEFGLTAFTRQGRIGVWVHTTNGQEAKIAALGIRVRKWVSFHGIALNVHPDLSHFNGIVPCGIANYGVTSLKAMGIDANFSEVDAALKRNFAKAFSPL